MQIPWIYNTKKNIVVINIVSITDISNSCYVWTDIYMINNSSADPGYFCNCLLQPILFKKQTTISVCYFGHILIKVTHNVHGSSVKLWCYFHTSLWVTVSHWCSRWMINWYDYQFMRVTYFSCNHFHILNWSLALGDVSGY